MSVIEMNKLSLMALNSDKEDILKGLMELEAVHIVDIAPGMAEDGSSGKMHYEEDISKLKENMDKIALVLKYLEKYDKRKKGLFSVRRQVSEESWERAVKDEERLWRVVDSIMWCDQQLVHLHAEKNRYSNMIASLYPWRDMNIPLDMTETHSTATLMGYVYRKTGMEELEKKLEERAKECFLQALSRDREHIYLDVIYHNGVKEAVREVLKDFGFTEVTFTEMKGTVQENILNAEKCIENIDMEYAHTSESMGAYADDMDQLEILYDHLSMERDRKKALIKMMGTRSTFILKGWIPANLSGFIAEKLEKKWDCMAMVEAPTDEDEYPILLKNGDMGKSVEAITAMYSLPNSKEIDPNGVMSAFFIFFYGLMLGDGVYGLIMISTAAFILWRVKLERNMYRFMKLMLYCGISTVIWGALFGGWFGIPALSKYNIWINPVETPEEFLYWSLLFGIIHIYVGMAIKGVNLFRSKKYMDIIWDVVSWYVLFTGFILFVLPYVFNSGEESFKGLVHAGKIMMAVGGGIVVLTQGRERKNIIMKFFGGVVKLYDLIKFMSDVLSYSRLMALGLATSVIGFIVYEIGIMNGTDNVIKIAGFVLILLAGHGLNFAIAVLGAYVHSSRLQYIEFFSRFYKGGGKPFKPLKANTKFTRLQGGKEFGYSILGNDR